MRSPEKRQYWCVHSLDFTRYVSDVLTGGAPRCKGPWPPGMPSEEVAGEGGALGPGEPRRQGFLGLSQWRAV